MNTKEVFSADYPELCCDCGAVLSDDDLDSWLEDTGDGFVCCCTKCVDNAAAQEKANYAAYQSGYSYACGYHD